MIDSKFWRHKRVFITGHSGFKGQWLSRSLVALGADVYGYSDKPFDWVDAEEPGLYRGHFFETIGNINDHIRLSRAIEAAQPDILFHMAAQALVIDGYNEPVRTFQDNVVGTACVLNQVRYSNTIRAVINVTSDKCYLNLDQGRNFTEDDRLGGGDPYSASKACAELVAASYTKSFFSLPESPGLASVRAGNVIGGMDWSDNRLVPDFYRATAARTPLEIRSPEATRPWQFVIEPLLGYMLLAERLFQDPRTYTGAWNFGPTERDVKSVATIVRLLNQQAETPLEILQGSAEFKESTFLMIDSTKARNKLGWRPSLSFEKGIGYTADWYRAWCAGRDTKEIVRNQILSVFDNGTA